MAGDTSDESADRTVAILLALAAVVGISWGARAALVTNDASSGWQIAVRQEIKRAAGAVEDVRYVYQDEAPIAFQIDEARLRAAQARVSAAKARGLTRKALLVEADTLSDFAAEIGKDIPKGVAGARYQTSKGGFDAARRLADQRRKAPDLVALDPDRSQRAGDRLSRQSLLGMLATIPAALAFFLAALAEVFRRPRRGLLWLSGAALVASVAFGAAVELAYA